MTVELLPQNIEAERGAISCLLQAPADVMNLFAERGLRADAFALPSLSLIYSAVEAAWGSREPCDFITITNRLRNSGELDAAGGAAAVTELFDYLPSAANAPYYAEIVLEKFKLRQMIALCDATRARCVSAQDEVYEIIRDTAERVADIARASLREKPITFNQHLVAKLNRFEQGEADDDLLTTGIAKLDEKSPVKRGDMPVIVGEAKAGKSILAITIAVNMALRGAAIGYSSHEMPSSEQTDRILHGTARVRTAHDHISKLREGELTAIQRAVTSLTGKRIDLRDDFNDISAVLAWGRSLKARWPDLSALFIDYLQLVRGVRHKNDTREMEIAGMSRALRALAMELKCAIFVLSQVNKDGDARESMSIEQDTTALWKIALSDGPGTRLITIPRQRNGESGIGFRVAFLGDIARVEDLASDDSDEDNVKLCGGAPKGQEP